ncbi:hypothetical protein ACFY3U_10860 [Micromonospora sp. NPDC000089]|uniref:hypothetical protein n=1 Tax=unclassified Micromonospora TaxID=2617518 RepID=UPI00367B98DC
MTSSDPNSPNPVRTALFFATPASDGPEEPGPAFDGSTEGMRRLRHPFAVDPTDQLRRSATTTVNGSAEGGRRPRR